MQGFSQISLTNTCGNCSRCPAWSVEKIYVLCLKLENLLKFKLFCINFKLKSIDFFRNVFSFLNTKAILQFILVVLKHPLPHSLISILQFLLHKFIEFSLLLFTKCKDSFYFFFFWWFFSFVVVVDFFFNTNRCTYT